ncbi:hypothetical protein HOLleu_06972 [Holothuria leucospilota]|uniref:GIY-YIG domain-containing protein n=1 Tax=Holothuria leucospilota TaxID=206669 RepID=A0A9Q1CNW0_HOLLE|nr:hypothetical protein HOLleu_06972 [Holothuria leucospilota]
MYPSNHPRSCTNSIPSHNFYGPDGFVPTTRISLKFPSRLFRIQGIDRASALAPKTDHTPTRRIPLVLSFHPSVTPIVRAIYRNVETLRHDPCTRDHFSEPPPPPSQNFSLQPWEMQYLPGANVVYVLVCKRCNILYVGETKRRLADRLTEHLRSIKQNLPGFPVVTHFNAPSTCSIRDLMVSAAISCRGSDHDRLAAENRLIMKLGTLYVPTWSER